MTYLYELIKNGKTTKIKDSAFRQNIIAMIIEDIPLIRPDLNELTFKVTNFKIWNEAIEYAKSKGFNIKPNL